MTVGELRGMLAMADEKDDVVVYADLEGKLVDIPPYFDKRAAVCGYFSATRVCVAQGAAVIMTGAETAL